MVDTWSCWKKILSPRIYRSYRQILLFVVGIFLGWTFSEVEFQCGKHRNADCAGGDRQQFRESMTIWMDGSKYEDSDPKFNSVVCNSFWMFLTCFNPYSTGGWIVTKGNQRNYSSEGWIVTYKAIVEARTTVMRCATKECEHTGMVWIFFQYCTVSLWMLQHEKLGLSHKDGKDWWKMDFKIPQEWMKVLYKVRCCYKAVGQMNSRSAWQTPHVST